MGARRKLNQAFFTGSVLLAGAAGALAQSWSVFFIALVVLLLSNLYLGEIRPGRRRGKGRRGHPQEEDRHEAE